LFLKIEEEGNFAELPDEAARIRWLASQNIQCPVILDFARHDGRWWLLTTALVGRDLASSPNLSPKLVIDIAAAALRDLHSAGLGACPFDHRLGSSITEARRRIEAGAVCEDQFEAKWEGYTAEALFDELVAQAPVSEDLVIAHGDPCLPNLMSDGRVFTGFVDCGKLGVSDRHRDLALVARSIRSNIGRDYVTPCFERYGLQPDPDKLAFYTLLDEFF
jgi:aminoglycoside 3'-phosphotransferase-2